MFWKKEQEVKITTLIGEGAELDGGFRAPGSARVDGHVNGSVSVTGTLIVGTTGRINGDVTADAVLIGGEVSGNIKAPQKAELTGTAKVIGDIATAVIVVDENAVFQGKCDMNRAEADEKPAEENRPEEQPEEHSENHPETGDTPKKGNGKSRKRRK